MDSGLSGHSSCSNDEEEQALLSSSSSTDSISSSKCAIITAVPTNEPTRTRGSRSSSGSDSGSDSSRGRRIMANYYTSGFEDVQNWPFSVRYTASPYRKSKLPVDSSAAAPVPYGNNANANGALLSSLSTNGSNTISSVGSNCSNNSNGNSIDCNVTARPHTHQHLQQSRQQYLHHQQWQNPNSRTHQSQNLPAYKDDYHQQQQHALHAELTNHNNVNVNVMMPGTGTGPGMPFHLQSHQQQQLFYQSQAHQHAQQQQYCSLNQIPTQQQQQSFFQSPVLLPPDHHHYGLPAHQQQSSQNGHGHAHGLSKNPIFFRQANTQTQFMFDGRQSQKPTAAGTGTAMGSNSTSSSSPFTVDGVILDEGYIEDLKPPTGLPAGNVLLIGSPASASAAASCRTGAVNLNGDITNNSVTIPQSVTFDYNYNPYSYVYDSQVLQQQQLQAQAQSQSLPPHFLVQHGDGAANFFGHPNSSSTPTTSSTTTIIERLRREAAALQAAAAAANSQMAAHRMSGSTVVNTSPSLSMKQCSIGGPPLSVPKSGLSRNGSMGNNSHGSRNSSFENEYEEISDVARYMSMSQSPNTIPVSMSTPNCNPTALHPPVVPSKLPAPLHFKSFSSTDDILAEVVQVREKHDRVLDQLNLEVENLLIRSSSEIILDSNSPDGPSTTTMTGPAKSGNHRKGVSDSGLPSRTRTTATAAGRAFTMDDHCYCNLPQSSNGQHSAAAGATSCINGTGDYCCAHSIDKRLLNRQACNSNNGEREYKNTEKGSGAFVETCGGPRSPSSAGRPCTSSYCSCCTTSINANAGHGSSGSSGNDITSGGGGGDGSVFHNNLTFANNSNSNRKKKLERIFGVTHSASFDSIAKDAKGNYKLQQQQQQLKQSQQQCNNDYCDCSFKSAGASKSKSGSGIGGGIVKSSSCNSAFESGIGAPNYGSSQAQPKHHRSYSIIPHWKIRDHLMRLPFLRHNSDKLKKSESTNSFSLSRSLQSSKKYKQQQQQQQFHAIVTASRESAQISHDPQFLLSPQHRNQPHHYSQLFQRDLTGVGGKLRKNKNRNSYIVTGAATSATSANVGAAKGNSSMASVKTKSSSMDELRPTEEHWYSADSDTDADSLTLLSAQQQQTADDGNGDTNANGNGTLVGVGFTSNSNGNNVNTNNGNVNSNTMTQSTVNSNANGVQLRRNSALENGQTLRHDIGVIPDAPKAPKFRRGPATTGLKEKWRESWTQSKTLSKTSLDDDNRLLRWFSLRKNQGGATLNNNMTSSNGGSSGVLANSSQEQNSTIVNNQRNSANPSTLQVLSEEDLKRISFTIEDEEGYWPRRTVQPPSLPPLPPDLTAEQLKRRHIVSAICHTENNYVAALQRLVNEYKKPLENSHPAILSHSKISAIFHRLPEILQCHSLFRIALAEYIRKWDTDEKIGDVFVASFSKSLVLDVYSEFINNFGTAMETAKSEARRKSVFAEFLKIKQITAHDRLSLFGLMVKPVQRFPQFILLLQDLLKQTPKDHHDRMSLQLALTQLESLAAMLNERKRESEQYQEMRETIKSISGGKFVLLRSVVDDPSRILLRQDVVTQLEFDSNGGSVAKSKCRKLLLLNDLLICVSLNQSSSNNSQSGSHDRNPSSSQQNINHNSKNEANAWGSTGKGEKSVFKWSYRVQEVEVDDISISPTMSRLVSHSSTASNSKLTRSSSLAPTPVENESQLSKCLLEEMQSLMYDYEVLSRILGLVSTLKTSYEGLNESSIKELMLGIQYQIRCRDEQISYFDSSCLTLLLGNSSSSNREKIVFQMSSPSARNEWIEELRLAQLALDPNNSPGWDIPNEAPYPHHKLPLFVRSIPLCRSPALTTVKCGTFFTHTFVSPTGRSKILDYLWVGITDGISSHVTAYRSQQNILKEVSSFDLMEEKINDLLFVSGHVWVATESSKILIYDPSDPDQAKGSVNQQTLSASVVKLTLFENVIYAGLADGHVAIFTQIHDPKEIQPTIVLEVGSERITSLFGSRDHVYASCGNAVVTIDIKTHTIERNVVLTHHNGPITHMACSGVGLWIAAGDTGTVCLYHLESLQHLQDVSIAPSVFRTVRDSYRRQKGCHVTCLVAQKGWLWIGTNLGVVLTIPLPRLEGVPIISTGKANVAYHGYYGPVTFLMPLVKQPRTIPIVNTSKTPRTMKSVQISGSTEIISAKELQQQQQLEMLEKASITPVVVPQAETENDDEESKAKNTTLTPTTTVPQNSNFELSPQSSISSGLSGSRDGSGNETLLAPGTTTPRSTSLSPSSSITASTNPSKALVVLRKKNSRDSVFARNCKTLPRGGLIPQNLRFSIDSDVYGLYGNLINVRGLEDEGRFVDPLYDALRRSDPELVALDAKINTMDRRFKMRMSRPRSLDLSNWSVDSKISVSSDESGGGSGGLASRLSGGSSNHGIENNAGTATQPVTITRHSSDTNLASSAAGAASSKPTDSAAEQSTSTTASHLNGGTSKRTMGRAKATGKSASPSKSHQDKTMIVITGGRGYINMKSQPLQDHYLQHTSSGSHMAESDAKQVTYLTVWQMKT